MYRYIYVYVYIRIYIYIYLGFTRTLFFYPPSPLAYTAATAPSSASISAKWLSSTCEYISKS